jgi:hypothetical protein
MQLIINTSLPTLEGKERGFASFSPCLVGKELGVRFKRKLHRALILNFVGASLSYGTLRDAVGYK